MKIDIALFEKKFRKSGIILILLIFFISTGFSQKIPARSSSKEEVDQTKLPQILEKTAEYCKKLENASLYFVCLEEIRERIFYLQRLSPLGLRFTNFFSEKKYTYDYQLIRKENNITERRILLEENGQKRYEKDAQLKTERFDHKYVIFGPVGILSEDWQSSLDYRILKEEKLKGEKVMVIEAVPKSDEGLPHLFGKAWVRKSDFSVLKIEWNQESLENFERIQEAAKSLGAEPKVTFISEYGLEKNGIRFPSRYSVKEEYVYPARRKFTSSETTVTYKNYKFFIVETEVIYKK